MSYKASVLSRSSGPGGMSLLIASVVLSVRCSHSDPVPPEARNVNHGVLWTRFEYDVVLYADLDIPCMAVMDPQPESFELAKALAVALIEPMDEAIKSLTAVEFDGSASPEDYSFENNRIVDAKWPLREVVESSRLPVGVRPGGVTYSAYMADGYADSERYVGQLLPIGGAGRAVDDPFYFARGVNLDSLLDVAGIPASVYGPAIGGAA